MLRRLKKDVLQELPDKTFQFIHVGSSDASVEREWRLKMEAARTGDVYSHLPKPDLIEPYRQYAIARKLPKIAQLVKDIAESEKVLVGLHHRSSIHSLAGMLSDYNPLMITGETSIQDRHIAVNAFQTDPSHKVMVCSMTAAGVGLTLTAARTVVIGEYLWTPALIHQFIDRVHRIGQKNSVNVYYATLHDSIDDEMFKKLLTKEKVINKIYNEQGLLFG